MKPDHNRPPLTYKEAGVDIDAGDALVEEIKPLGKSTDRAGVVGGLVGALFGIALAVATEGLVNRFFQARYDTSLVFIRVTAPIAAKAVAVAAPLGVVAGIAASWTLLRRNVLSLFRR